MAGSYNHVVTDKGTLRDQDSTLINNLGDAFEAIEEMYGMIWFLADRISNVSQADARDAVEEARTNYLDGLRAARRWHAP